MKHTAAVITLFLASQMTWAHGLTNGHYTGQGLSKTPQSDGRYTTTVDVTNNTIKASYKLSDGSTQNWDITLTKTSSVFFDVVSQGQKLGSGYCLQGAPVCHYEISMKQLKLEETLVQEGNKIYRFGSKDEGQGRVMWQESLNQELKGKE
jgi:hypothetical protein